MPHRRRYAEDKPEYPDAMPRTVLDIFGVSKGHVYLAGLMLLGGGAEHFHISNSSDRLEAVEKVAEAHTHILGDLDARLRSIEQGQAVLQSQMASQTLTTTGQFKVLSDGMDEVKRSIYRMEGMAAPPDKVSLNR